MFRDVWRTEACGGWTGWLVLAAVFAGPLPGRAEPAAPAAVVELRRALAEDREPSRNPGALAYRKANLQKKVAALRTLPDLGNALLLEEWRLDSLDQDLRDLD